jgi:hypothetical protein
VYFVQSGGEDCLTDSATYRDKEKVVGVFVHWVRRFSRSQALLLIRQLLPCRGSEYCTRAAGERKGGGQTQ